MRSEDYVGKHAYQGKVADRYDHDRQGEEIWTREQRFVVEWAAALPKDASILDLPTGTGRFVEGFLGLGLRVLAMDISDDMLAAVRRRWPAETTPRLTVATGDAEHLPLADGSVDYVLSWRLVHLLPPAVLPAVLREFRRVARAGVVLQVFAVRPAGARAPWGEPFRRRLRPLWRRLRSAFGGPTVHSWNHITSYAHREEDLRAAFAQAGLRLVRTHGFGSGADGLLNQVYFLEIAEARGTAPFS